MRHIAIRTHTTHTQCKYNIHIIVLHHCPLRRCVDSWAIHVQVRSLHRFDLDCVLAIDWLKNLQLWRQHSNHMDRMLRWQSPSCKLCGSSREAVIACMAVGWVGAWLATKLFVLMSCLLRAILYMYENLSWAPRQSLLVPCVCPEQEFIAHNTHTIVISLVLCFFKNSTGHMLSHVHRTNSDC